MAQDYMKRSQHRRKPNNQQPQSPSSLLLLLSGMIGGLFIAAIIYFAILQPKQQSTSEVTAPLANNAANNQVAENVENSTTAAENSAVTETTEPANETKPPEEGTPFEFYTLLPQSEVIVPNHETAVSPAVPPTTPQNNANNATVANASFILQAGSFRNAKDADQLRARLLLMGFEARVQAVTIKPGETWHRVQVGPFKSTEATKKAQATLTEANIETLLLKLK